MRIPDELRRATQRQMLVPLVGAGVSHNVRRPDGQPLFVSWSQLIKSAAATLRTRADQATGSTSNELKSDADFVDACAAVSNKLREGAQHAREILGPSIWNSMLVEEFNKPVPTDAPGLELARRVWLVASNLVLTFNYDRVLQAACGNACDTIDSSSSDRLIELCSRAPTTPTVWHIHGTMARPSDVVLTLDSYSQMWPLGDDAEVRRAKVQFEAAQLTLTSLLLTRTLLFVGTSIENVLLEKMHELQRIFRGARFQHFALMHDERGQLDLVRRIERLGTNPQHLGLNIIVPDSTGSSENGAVADFLQRLHVESSPRLSPALPLLFGRAYRRKTSNELQGSDVSSVVEIEYHQLGTTGAGELEIPFTFDYVDNEKAFGVPAQLQEVQVSAVDDDVRALCSVADPFDPALHGVRYASRIRFTQGRDGLGSARIRARGLRLFTRELNRRDSSQWLSNAFYGEATFEFVWRRPLWPTSLKAIWTEQKGMRPIELPVTPQPSDEGWKWIIRREQVRVGATLELSWIAGVETAAS